MRKQNRFYPCWQNSSFNDENGAASVEFALSLPAIVLLILLIVAAFMGGVVKMQACGDARNLARAYALNQEGALNENNSNDSLIRLRQVLDSQGADYQILPEEGLVKVEVKARKVRALPSISCSMSVFDENN